MAKAPTPLDISADSPLRQLAEEVAASGTPRVLRRDGEDVAVLLPVRAKPPMRRIRVRKTEADHQAFLASAGAWADLVDTEQLKADIAASRAMSSRPLIEL